MTGGHTGTRAPHSDLGVGRIGPDSIKLLIHQPPVSHQPATQQPAAPALFIKSADLMELYYPALMNLDCTNEGTLILILSSRFTRGHAILKY